MFEFMSIEMFIGLTYPSNAYSIYSNVFIPDLGNCLLSLFFLVFQDVYQFYLSMLLPDN